MKSDFKLGVYGGFWREIQVMEELEPRVGFIYLSLETPRGPISWRKLYASSLSLNCLTFEESSWVPWGFLIFLLFIPQADKKMRPGGTKQMAVRWQIRCPWLLRACSFGHLRAVLSVWVASDSVTPWTVAYQAPLSTELSRQEYWSGKPFPTP